MAVDPELLAILVCPKSKGELELIALPPEVRAALAEKYREHFRDEEPVVEQGLFCAAQLDRLPQDFLDRLVQSLQLDPGQ